MVLIASSTFFRNSTRARSSSADWALLASTFAKCSSSRSSSAFSDAMSAASSSVSARCLYMASSYSATLAATSRSAFSFFLRRPVSASRCFSAVSASTFLSFSTSSSSRATFDVCESSAEARAAPHSWMMAAFSWALTSATCSSSFRSLASWASTWAFSRARSSRWVASVDAKASRSSSAPRSRSTSSCIRVLLLFSSSTVVPSRVKVTAVRSERQWWKAANSSLCGPRPISLEFQPVSRSTATGSRRSCRHTDRTEECTFETTSELTCLTGAMLCRCRLFAAWEASLARALRN
mmetsp:Transcript_60147/g.135999  ORF Transcript_60147/g.135999 Transcript_60147/m.135999 type:complete len:294 (+) Transcript_60147:269-1150(+)